MNYSRKNTNFDKITDYYEVEKIITRRLVGKNKIYLIKWAGYPIKDCTWEPISHLDKINFLVEDFDNNFPESIDKRQLRKYIHATNKRRKQALNTRYKIIRKNLIQSKINKNNHIIINTDDYSIIDTKIDEDGKVKDKTLMVDIIEIPEEKKTENDIKENQIELKEPNCGMKLKRPILIW